MNELVKIGKTLKTLTIISIIVYSLFTVASVVSSAVGASLVSAQTNFILSLDNIKLVLDNGVLPVSAGELTLTLISAVIRCAFGVISLIFVCKIFDVFSNGDALTPAIPAYLRKIAVICIVSGVVKNILSVVSRYLLIERLDHGNALIGGNISDCTISYNLNLSFIGIAVLVIAIAKILDLVCEYKEKADRAEFEKNAQGQDTQSN